MNQAQYKVVVAHPEQQHSYRLAVALERIGLLDAYMTTVYFKKKSWTYKISRFLPDKFYRKSQKRVCPELPDKQVVILGEKLGLLTLLSVYVSFLRPFYKKLRYYMADCFARAVARYAVKHSVHAVVTYDNCSAKLFKSLRKNAPHILRILDMSSIARSALRNICEQDCKKTPAFAARLKKERAFVWDEQTLKNAQEEINFSDFFLVPSNFVKKSLLALGVKEDQVLLCPYGVDIAEFSIKQYVPVTARPLNFIYVGGMKELKGMYYLLEAFKRIPKEKATLTIVGTADAQAPDLKPYVDTVHFTGSVLHAGIPALLRQADVFILPSLVEGLSLSSLEAAACGLPLVVSKHSGVNDLITEGQEGFVIEVQSIDAIVEKVNWFIEHPDQIEPMGLAARKLAERYTWEAYYKRAGKLVFDIIQQTSECKKKL